MLLGQSAMCNQVWAGWGGQQSVRWKEFYSWLVPNTCAAPKNGYTTYMRGINTTEYRWYNLYRIETVNLSLNFVPIILFWYNMLIQHKSSVQTMIYNFYTPLFIQWNVCRKWCNVELYLYTWTQQTRSSKNFHLSQKISFGLLAPKYSLAAVLIYPGLFVTLVGLCATS